MEGTSDDLQIRCSIITTALRKHFARFVYRLGHCPFTAGRRGSIPPPSTIFNYIGLPKPVGCLGIGCLDGDGCAKCHERWKRSGVLQGCRMMKRIRWSRWRMLARNVRSNQSLDDSVVSHQVVVVADHPSVINYGISLVLSRYRYRTL